MFPRGGVCDLKMLKGNTASASIVSHLETCSPAVPVDVWCRYFRINTSTYLFGLVCRLAALTPTRCRRVVFWALVVPCEETGSRGTFRTHFLPPPSRTLCWSCQLSDDQGPVDKNTLILMTPITKVLTSYIPWWRWFLSYPLDIHESLRQSQFPFAKFWRE